MPIWHAFFRDVEDEFMKSLAVLHAGKQPPTPPESRPLPGTYSVTRPVLRTGALRL
jgi:hypothetical protein